MSGSGVLVGQLPRPLAADPVLAGFVSALEEVADSVLERVDCIEGQFDPGTASPAMLVRLGVWFGVDADIGAGPDGTPTGIEHDGVQQHEVQQHERDLVRIVGALQGWRGTRKGLQGLAAALTGTTARVEDPGGVHGIGVVPPPSEATVTVTVSGLGPMTRDRLEALLSAELPIGAQLRLVVGSRRASAPASGRN